MFDFRLDLPLHRQSAAARFGVLGIVLGTAVPVRDCGTFAAGEIISDFGTIVVPCMDLHRIDLHSRKDRTKVFT